MLTTKHFENMAAAGAVIPLPLLYIGMSGGNSVLTAIGFIMFFASMAVTPIRELRQRG